MATDNSSNLAWKRAHRFSDTVVQKCDGCRVESMVEHECQGRLVQSQFTNQTTTTLCKCSTCHIDPKTLKRFIQTLGIDDEF